MQQEIFHCFLGFYFFYLTKFQLFHLSVLVIELLVRISSKNPNKVRKYILVSDNTMPLSYFMLVAL